MDRKSVLALMQLAIDDTEIVRASGPRAGLRFERLFRRNDGGLSHGGLNGMSSSVNS
jgi:hypothetical protein